MINLALYREYRPKNFDEVIGQDHIITTLKNQISSSSLSHAYLFCGTRGIGKTSTAKIFAKAVNCLGPKNGSPCGECEVCKKLSQNANLDILEIDAASNNRVDEIRELRDKIKYPPVCGKYKVYIIDEVHMLTESAFNALLKTLEEPPSHAIFILCTTEVHKLPKTILSRCMRFDFKLVGNEDLTRLLEKVFNEKGISYEKEALNLIALRGEGSVRDTLSVADLCASFCNKNITYSSCVEALGSANIDELIALTDALNNCDGEKLLVQVNNFMLSGKNFTILNKELISHLKTLLTIKMVKNGQEFLMMPKEYYEKLRVQADSFDCDTLLHFMTKLSQIETSLKYSVDPKTMCEITLLSLINEKKTENIEKKTKFIAKNTEKSTENSEKNIETNEKNIKNFENTHKNLSSLQQKKESENVVIENSINQFEIIGKILNCLRENNCHLLLSVYQNLEKVEICKNKFIVEFLDENFKNILENSDNILLINDIIKNDNLVVEYKYKVEKQEDDIEKTLKEKFNEIDIKE